MRADTHSHTLLLRMHWLLAVILIATLFGIAAPSASPALSAPSAACITLQPGETNAKDAWINQDNVTDNKNDSELRVKTETGRLNRSLLQFDLTSVPHNALITSATLSLWVKDVNSGNSTVRAHRVTNSWNEIGVTWNSRDKTIPLSWGTPGGDYDNTVLDSESFTVNVQNYWATFNVVGAAQTWAANPANNYGLILEAAVTNPKSEIKFKSSGDGTASERPKLEICYQIGVGISPNNLGQGAAGATLTYTHTVTMQDLANEPVNLNASSSLGWTTRIYADADKNGVKDSQTSIAQTPPLGPNGSYGIVVEVDVPANVVNGAKDITTITVTGANNGTTDTATNTTGIGLPPTSAPVLDGKRDAAYTQNLAADTQAYCDASGNVLARTMSLYDASDPNYVWVILEIERQHADNTYGVNQHPTWTAAGKSQTLNNLIGSDKGQLLVYDANHNLVFDVTADYLEDNLTTTLSGYGSAGVTDGEGSVAVGVASQVAVETSMGYNLNRYCTGLGSCTVQSTNLLNTSPAINVNYVPANPFFNDWQFSYLYEFRFDASAFGSAGFGSAKINNVHISPNKTGANEILVTPCNGSIGDRVWLDEDGDGIQDAGENGINGVLLNLYQDNGDGILDTNTDLSIDSQFTSGDGDYDFTGLGPGVYFVDVVESTIPSAYVLTTANEPYKVTLAKGQDFNDADFGYRTLPDLAISKHLSSSDPAYVGQEIVFTILITNTGNTIIDVLPLQDFFDPALLEFSSATPAQSSVANGVVTWNDLTTSLGNLAQNQTATVTVRFRAKTTTSMAAAASARTVRALSAEPTVDGLLDSDYVFVKRTNPGSDAPGNLYRYDGSTLCYYAFVVDRSFNDNVYTETDTAYLAQDGWYRTHKFNDLVGSDQANFDISYIGGSYTDLAVDYISLSNGNYIVAFFDSPIQQAGSSLVWNINNSGWNGVGPAPHYNGNPTYHSPPYNWNDAPGQYWEWHMIYEFAIPKSAMNNACGTIELGGAHNSPSKNDATLGTIGDYIWTDLDGQGDQDETLAGIPGVRVYLKQNGNIVRTTQTEPGTTGYYLFNNVAAGTYVVDVDESTLPTGYTLTTNNEPKTVTIAAGEDYLQADFGYVPGQGTIGDRVYYDIDGSGNPDDDSEPGLNGVTVKLYQGSCPTGGGTVFKTQVTSGNGDYLFTNLPAGQYCVNVDESTLPANVSLTTSNEPLPVTLAQDQHFLTADFGYRVQQTGKTCDVASVASAVDQYGTTPDAVSDYACVVIEPARAAIGDFVWYDADGDGIQDVGEPGIPNVRMALYEETDGTPGKSAGDLLVDTTVTDADGGYMFNQLPPGTYYVDVVDAADPNGTLNGWRHTTGAQSMSDPTGPISVAAGEVYKNADFGYVQDLTGGNAIIGDTVWYDADGDGIQQPSEPGIPNIQVCATPTGGGAPICDTTDNNGHYLVTVPAGEYTVAPTNPPANYTATTPVPHGPVTVAAGEQYLDADFGYTDGANNLLGTIGNLVFWDKNKDGIFNNADVALPGVSVDLIRDTNNDGSWDLDGVDNILGNADDEVIIASVTTGSSLSGNNGNYLFTGVPAGNYLVHISDTNAVLVDFVKSPLGSQNADNTNKADPYLVVLTAGADNLLADFGYYQSDDLNSGVIGNQVWIESDENGLFDPEDGDFGQPGVTVDLYKDNVFYARTTTGASGDYSFVNLPAGNYSVRVSDEQNVLAGYVVTTLGPNQGQDHNNQQQPYAVVLPANGVNLTADFGYKLVKSDFIITKKLNTPEPVRTGDVLSFTIRITNTSPVTITVLPLTDNYDTEYLSYLGGTPQSDDNISDGVINWSDLTGAAPKGFNQDLIPGASFAVVVEFVAVRDTTELPNGVTINTATVAGAKADPDGPGGATPQSLPTKSANDDVEIFAPTAVALADYSATAGPAVVHVHWKTETESNIAFFELYRIEGEQSLLLGTIQATHAGQPTSATYVYEDTGVNVNTWYEYQLKVIGLDGSTINVGIGKVYTGGVQIFLPTVTR